MKKVDALYAIKQFGRISKELGYKLTKEQIFELACLSKGKTESELQSEITAFIYLEKQRDI